MERMYYSYDCFLYYISFVELKAFYLANQDPQKTQVKTEKAQFNSMFSTANDNLAHALTTDSDLHDCEETQLAATTLVRCTHNTQLFTFS